MPDQALATGRRKRSIARVRVLPGDGTITVNDLPIERYITSLVQRVKILDPLRVSGVQGSYNVLARVVAALDRLRIERSPAEFVRVGGLELAGDGRSEIARFPATIRWPDHGVVARRSVLDARILAAAETAGAEFRPGVRALGPLME